MTPTPTSPRQRLLSRSRQAVHGLVGVLFVGTMTFPAPVLGATAEFTDAHYVANVRRDAWWAARHEHQQTLPAVAGITSSTIPQAGALLAVTATAYSATAGETDVYPNRTASGAVPGPGTIAANFLPLGSIVRIGTRLYTVTDRLHSRFNGQYVIDLWLPTAEAARAFGVRRLDIVVLSVP